MSLLYWWTQPGNPSIEIEGNGAIWPWLSRHEVPAIDFIKDSSSRRRLTPDSSTGSIAVVAFSEHCCSFRKCLLHQYGIRTVCQKESVTAKSTGTARMYDIIKDHRLYTETQTASQNRKKRTWSWNTTQGWETELRIQEKYSGNNQRACLSPNGLFEEYVELRRETTFFKDRKYEEL